MVLEDPAFSTGSQPMRRQERGDVGGGIFSKVEELRRNTSSKGLAWLKKKVASMPRDDLQKVAAASGARGAFCPAGESVGGRCLVW
jgi:hypothetical protein